MSECPKCKSGLLRNAKSCACGWGKPPRQSAPWAGLGPQENNRDCAYQTGSMRCRFPGSISHGTNGGGPWYCRVHARDLGNQIARQCLEQSQTYRLPRPPEDDLKEFTWLATNFPMRDGETRPAYNLRCRKKSMGAGFEMKRIVNSEPTRMREPGEDMVEL